MRPARAAAGYLGMGVLLGLTALLKPHLAAAFAAPLAPIAWRLWRETRSPVALIGRGARLAGGVAAVLGPLAIYFAANGAWDDLVHTVVVYNSGHLALSWTTFSFADVLARGLWNLARFITPFGWIGLFLCVYRNRDRNQLAAMGLVSALIGLLFLGVLLQGKLIKYHYGAIFPLYGLLVGWGWWRFWEMGRGSWQRSAALIAAFALIPSTWGSSSHFNGRNGVRLKLALSPERSLEYVSALYRHDDFHMGENLLVADWIRSHTRDSDEVYIWGFEPVIYFMAQREMASRYLFNVPMRAEWSKQEYRRSLMDELGRSAPELLIVMSNDVFPWVSGNLRDSRTELTTFAELRGFVSDGYVLAQEIGDFAIFVRRPGGPEVAAPAAPRREAFAGGALGRPLASHD